MPGCALHRGVEFRPYRLPHLESRDRPPGQARQFVDPETDDAVTADQQVKGYEVAKGEYVMLEPEEVAAAVPESDKTLDVEAFIDCGDIDDIYFDRPYYLAPSSAAAQEAFALIREGMRSEEGRGPRARRSCSGASARFWCAFTATA